MNKYFSSSNRPIKYIYMDALTDIVKELSFDELKCPKEKLVIVELALLELSCHLRSLIEIFEKLKNGQINYDKIQTTSDVIRNSKYFQSIINNLEENHINLFKKAVNFALEGSVDI